MKKSCKYCGGIHDIGYICPMKPKKKIYDYTDRETWRIRHSATWNKKAIEIKERDKYLCVMCLKEKRLNYIGLEVHHIVPIEEDKTKAYDNDNLITLCREHHELAEVGKITRKELVEAVTGTQAHG